MGNGKRWAFADAHADSLMWNRDLTRANARGQVDFPKLIDAGVVLQCFTIVTRGLPWLGGLPALAALRRWPARAWSGEWASADWQIESLIEFCRRSEGGKVRLTTDAATLRENLAAGRVSAVLGVEGGHALEGRVERVPELYRRGVRFMGLTHLSNNELGGSSYRFLPRRGLSPLGHQVLEAMVQAKMAVDLAHASRPTLMDILATRQARVFCSHTGVKAEKDSWRNLDDATLREIADRGGVIGIIFATIYLGGRSLEDLARHIEHAVDVAGEDAVALGSDFDGMVPLPKGIKDVRDLPCLAELLSDRGCSPRRVEKICSGNLLRFFSEVL